MRAYPRLLLLMGGPADEGIQMGVCPRLLLLIGGPEDEGMDLIYARGLLSSDLWFTRGTSIVSAAW